MVVEDMCTCSVCAPYTRDCYMYAFLPQEFRVQSSLFAPPISAFPFCSEFPFCTTYLPSQWKPLSCCFLASSMCGNNVCPFLSIFVCAMEVQHNNENSTCVNGIFSELFSSFAPSHLVSKRYFNLIFYEMKQNSVLDPTDTFGFV